MANTYNSDDDDDTDGGTTAKTATNTATDALVSKIQDHFENVCELRKALSELDDTIRTNMDKRRRIKDKGERERLAKTIRSTERNRKLLVHSVQHMRSEMQSLQSELASSASLSAQSKQLATMSLQLAAREIENLDAVCKKPVNLDALAQPYKHYGDVAVATPRMNNDDDDEEEAEGRGSNKRRNRRRRRSSSSDNDSDDDDRAGGGGGASRKLRTKAVKHAQWEPTPSDFRPFWTFIIVLMSLLFFAGMYTLALPLLVQNTNECNIFHVCNDGDECIAGICVQKEILTMELRYNASTISFNSMETTIVYDGDEYPETQIRYSGGSTADYPKKSYRVEFSGKFQPPAGLSRCISLRAEYNDRSYIRNYISHQLYRKTTAIPIALVRYIRVVGTFENDPNSEPEARLYLSVMCNDEEWLSTFKKNPRAPTYRTRQGDRSVGEKHCLWTPLPLVNETTTYEDTYAYQLQPLAGDVVGEGEDDMSIVRWVNGCLNDEYLRLLAIPEDEHWEKYRTTCLRETVNVPDLVRFLHMRMIIMNEDDAIWNQVVSRQDGKLQTYPADFDRTWGCYTSTLYGGLCDDLKWTFKPSFLITPSYNETADTYPCTGLTYNRMYAVAMRDGEANACRKQLSCDTLRSSVWESDLPEIIAYLEKFLWPVIQFDVSDRVTDDRPSYQSAIDDITTFMAERKIFLEAELECGKAHVATCNLFEEPSHAIGIWIVFSLILGLITVTSHYYVWKAKAHREIVSRVLLGLWSVVVWVVVVQSIIALFFGGDKGEESEVGLANPSHSGAAARTTSQTLFKQTMSKDTFEKLIFLIVLYIFTLQVPMWTRFGFGVYHRRDNDADNSGDAANVSSIEMITRAGQMSSVSAIATTKRISEVNDDYVNSSDDDEKDLEAGAAGAGKDNDEMIMAADKTRTVHLMIVGVIIFYWICAIAYVAYAFSGSDDEQRAQFTLPSLIVVVISLMAMVLMRAFWSSLKWVWLWYLGVSMADMDIAYGMRGADTWSMQHWLDTYDVRSLRTADGYPKKIVHMFDGIISFLGSLLAAGTVSKFEVSAAFAFGALLTTSQMILYLLTYRNNGALAWLMYGAKARIMDGSLGRANELFGWLTDKMMMPVMVPLSIWMTSYFGDSEMFLAAITIFGPIIVGDAFGEFIGASFGKHTIKVCGIGETNRKSWEGTKAVFVSSLITLMVVYMPMQASFDWYMLAPFACAVATATELYAPRSTDNVFMAVMGVIVLGAFGEITGRRAA